MHKGFELLLVLKVLWIRNLCCFSSQKVKNILIPLRQQISAFTQYAFHSSLTRIMEATCKLQASSSRPFIGFLWKQILQTLALFSLWRHSSCRLSLFFLALCSPVYATLCSHLLCAPRFIYIVQVSRQVAPLTMETLRNVRSLPLRREVLLI